MCLCVCVCYPGLATLVGPLSSWGRFVGLHRVSGYFEVSDVVRVRNTVRIRLESEERLRQGIYLLKLGERLDQTGANILTRGPQLS